MSKVFTSILILSTIALADPTHFLDGKWYSCDKTEYDSKGNEIYDKNADGSEHWIIYDEKGHLFQMKSTAKDLNDTIIKTITTYKTDARGNVIYSKDSFGTEKWNEYNKWNKLTRIKDNTGLEILNEYDKKGNYLKNSLIWTGLCVTGAALSAAFGGHGPIWCDPNSPARF